MTANGLTLASCSTNADLGAGTCTICSRQSREVDFDTNTCHDVKPPQGYAMLGTGGVSLDAEGLRLAACGIEASETGACFVYHRDSVNADFKSVDFLKIVPENSEPLWRFGQTGTFLSPNGKIVSACRYNDPAHVATVAQPTKMLDRGICYVFDIDVLGQGGTGVVEGSDYREVLIPEDVVATSPGFGLGGLFVNDDAVFVGCSAAADVCYFGSIECQCDSSYGFRSGTCALCEAGTFSSQVGNNPCELCSVGTYNAQNGATACQSCPNNTTTSSVGANAVDYCKSESESEKELYEKPEFMVPIILGSVALLGGWAFLGMAKFGDEEESPEMSAI